MADASGEGGAAVAGPSAPAEPLHEKSALEERRRAEEERRAQDPPLVFKDIDAAAEVEALERALGGESAQLVDELRQYLVQGEGSWVLSEEFVAQLGHVLTQGDAKAREAALRCMCACALRDDVSLVLHQDRRDHALLNFAQEVDRAPIEQQRALATFFCNLFENLSSAEWLLYISEWEHQGRPLSNIRVTTKVAVHSLLAEDETLRERGAALMYNVAAKEVKTVVFEEVSVELALALATFLQQADGQIVPEELVWRCACALARLAERCPLGDLLSMLALDPARLKGVSARVDQQAEKLQKHIK